MTILDYKTDTLSAGQIGDAVARYSPQVALYALAAETILGKPVQKVVIAFLTAGEVHEVDWKSYLAARGFSLGLNGSWEVLSNGVLYKSCSGSVGR